MTLKLSSARVSVTGYTMTAYEDGQCGYPASWVVEVSDDEKSWKTIDRQQTDALSQPKASQTFTCAAPNDEPARFVRLRQTGNGIKQYNGLALGSIDFTGKYYLRLRDYPYRGEPLGGILWHRKTSGLGYFDCRYREWKDVRIDFGYGKDHQLSYDSHRNEYCASINLDAKARLTHVTIKNGKGKLNVVDVRCASAKIDITLTSDASLGQIWNPWEFKTFQFEDTSGFISSISIHYKRERGDHGSIPDPCISEVDVFGAALEPEDE